MTETQTAAKYCELFTTFFKVGTFTIGGGYAMIPLIQREVVERRRWLGEEEFLDLLSLSQAMPGVLAVNMATTIGYRLRGYRGSAVAIVGNILMPILFILMLALFFRQFKDIPAVQHAFAGIRACVCVLILNAVVKLWKKSVIDWKTGAVFAVVFLGSVFLHLSPVIYVIVAAAAGILLKRLEVKA